MAAPDVDGVGAREIDLSGDELGLATAEHIRVAAQQALDDGATHYTTRPGLDPLRRRIAEKLERENGIVVDAQREVVVTCGTQEALFVALHVLLGPRDEALIPQPAPRSFSDIVRLAGGSAKAVPTDPEQGFALDPDEVARRIGRRTRLLLLQSPSAPGGWVAGDRLEALAQLAAERGIVVVSLETLEPFTYDGSLHRSIGALPGMAERTVTINGFSAAYAMHGWRVGYMAGPRNLLGPMIDLKQALSICSPAVSQYAALAAIEGSRTPVDGARAAVSARRDVTFAALSAAQIPFVRPAGGYHVMLDTRGNDTDGRGLARTLQRTAGVRLLPGAAFGARGWQRLSLTKPVDVLEQAVMRLRPHLGRKGGANG
jgi:aspartate/methionine/tyrosine aminotransferase